jgi:hypothetical protein
MELVSAAKTHLEHAMDIPDSDINKWFDMQKKKIVDMITSREQVLSLLYLNSGGVHQVPLFISYCSAVRAFG